MNYRIVGEECMAYLYGVHSLLLSTVELTALPLTGDISSKSIPISISLESFAPEKKHCSTLHISGSTANITQEKPNPS